MKDRILLVAAPLGFEAVYPLELAFLAGALARRRIPCTGLDARRDPGCLESIDLRSRPRAIVLDTSIRNLPRVLETADMLRRRAGCPVILVGTAAAVHARRLAAEPSVDAVVTGDSEEVVPALLESGLPLGKAVPGALARGPSGRLLESGPRFQTLVGHAPDRRVFPVEAYCCHPVRGSSRHAAIEATRGCTLACDFCPVPTRFHGIHRARPVGAVLDEMACLRRDHDIGTFRFEDEQPLMDRMWFQELLSGIRRSLPNVHLEFPNGLRPDLVDRDLLGEMAASGTRRLAWGIETANPGLRSRIGRPLDIDHVRRLLRRGRALGMVQAVYFQLGLPGETSADRIATLALAATLPAEYPHLSIHWQWRRPLNPAPDPGGGLAILRGAGYCLAYGSPMRLGALARAGDLDPRRIPDMARAFGRWLGAGEIGGGTW